MEMLIKRFLHLKFFRYPIVFLFLYTKIIGFRFMKWYVKGVERNEMHNSKM